ncbi:MAG: sugar porter family MFS transporter [Verrucomicrobia bacterium]|nr:sugar porter family MFS transporter [Verrucomicrobiota bacterium]
MKADNRFQRRGFTLALVSLVAAFGGFLFGYDTAVINGANQYLKLHFNLTPLQEGMAGASAILGCIPGAMVAGFLSDRFGRRKVLFLCAAIYAISGVLSAVPRTFPEFLAARFLSGLGIGASSMICPIYIAELAPPATRGRLGALFQLGIVTGIFLTLFINAQIQGLGSEAWNRDYGWRWMMAAETAPAAVLFGLLLFAPESPRWLLQAGREPEARSVLSRVFSDEEIERQIAEIREAMAQEEGRFFELFRKGARRTVILAVALMATAQFSGINAILYYSTKIFAAAGIGVNDAFLSSAIVGLVNLLFTFVAIAFVDRAGRRVLLLIGLTTQVLALGAVGWMFHVRLQGLGLLAAILVYIAAFAMALGPVPWIICSEIFPARLRGRAMSIASLTVWVCCYIVAQTFPMLNDSPAVGPAKTFWIYGVCAFLGLLFIWAKVPETKGRTLEENFRVISGGIAR